MSVPTRARVFNDSPWEHREKFNGQWISIPANGSIEMDFYKAHEFKGQYFPIFQNKDGQHDERCAKRIRVVPIEGTKEAAAESHVCQSCRYTASSKADLEEHIDAKHLEDLEDQELAEKRRKAKKIA